MENTTNFASAWQTNNALFSHCSHKEPGPLFRPEASLGSTPSRDEEINPSVPIYSSNRTCSSVSTAKRSGPTRLNKFVRRLHDMLETEKDSGIVEWRKGLLVLHSTAAFAKKILPKYFNTQNFKTFRRQLNYYGFVHVRSFSTTGTSTTALWVNQDLAKRGTSSISSVLLLKRVEPCDESKTAEGRRLRKEEATHTIEDIGINAHSLQMEQIRQLATRGTEISDDDNHDCSNFKPPCLPQFVHLKSELDAHSLSCSSTPSLAYSDLSLETDGASYPTTDDDAANLLIMFSKSAQNFD
jgi:Heat shock transcription factor